jgi:hypothetical protein
MAYYQTKRRDYTRFAPQGKGKIAEKEGAVVAGGGMPMQPFFCP